MRTKNIFLACIMACITAFIMTACTQSLDDWDETLIYISFEGKSSEKLTYEIDISGPTSSRLTAEDGDTIEERVRVGGNYTISVTAFSGEKEYARGSTEITIKAGINYITITLERINGVATPTVDLPPKAYTGAQKVKLFCSTQGAEIYYTINGGVPTKSDSLYNPTEGITLNTQGDNTLKAIASHSSLDASMMLEAVYTLTAGWNAAVEENIPKNNNIKIKFTFDLDITADIKASNILIVNQTGAFTKGTLTRSGNLWTLSGTITRGGTIEVSLINISGFENMTQTLEIYGIFPVWTAVADSTFGSRTISFGGMSITSYATIYGITWGGSTEQQKFVAVGASLGSAGNIAYSADGIVWTNGAYSTYTIRNIAWNGSVEQEKFIIGYAYSQVLNSTGIAYSNDGTTWDTVLRPINMYNIPYNGSINSIAWGGSTGQEKFVTVGYQQAGAPLGAQISAILDYSTNGIDWTIEESALFESSIINGIVWGGDKFVAVGADGKMAYSTNGSTWTLVNDSTFGSTAIRGITWGGSAGQEKFVIVGDNCKMAYSPVP